MAYCLRQAIERTSKLHLLTGLKPDFDCVEAEAHKSRIDSRLVGLHGKLTDAQLRGGVSSVCSTRIVARPNLTAQL